MIKILTMSVLTAVGTIIYMTYPANQEEESVAIKSDYKPQFHFSPIEGWMNDPNGLVFYDGEYHLFYQHNPVDVVWGPMHWGHAVSDDLINWKHLPIALYPDSLGQVWSGSAVIDKNNTSGLGSIENPPMVAIYTYHDMPAEKAGVLKHQAQSIAYSIDKGRTWKRYSGNPVLENPGIWDFRDPKVFWHENTQKWIMVLAVKDHIGFYSSPNLINWSLESEFGLDKGSHDGVWECPDLFELTDEHGEQKWVLLVSVNPGGPNGGSATQYFIGGFDGSEFKAVDEEIRWVDYGTDNYAGVTFSGIEDGRTIILGWMNNWNYANLIPETGSRGAATLPRTVKLENNLLKSVPVQEVKKLRSKTTIFQNGNEPILLPEFSEIELSLKEGLNNFSYALENKIGEKIQISVVNGEVSVDRTTSGRIDFEGRFDDPIKTLLKSPIQKIHMFIDRTSIEVFINNGELVLTNLVFPENFYNALNVMNGKEKVSSVKVHTLTKIAMLEETLD